MEQAREGGTSDLSSRCVVSIFVPPMRTRASVSTLGQNRREENQDARARGGNHRKATAGRYNYSGDVRGMPQPERMAHLEKHTPPLSNMDKIEFIWVTR